MPVTIKRFLTAVLATVCATAAFAHEMQANRLTMVLRDDTHLSLTYFVDYAQALHQVLAPRQPLQEFVLTVSSMKPAEFDAALVKAHAQLSAGTRITLPTGEAVVISKWQWPEPARARALLQARAMQMVVGSGVGAGNHAHDPPVEARAEATASRRMASVSVRLPPELGPVLVVSYRPRQAWARPTAAPVSPVAPIAPLTIKF